MKIFWFLVVVCLINAYVGSSYGWKYGWGVPFHGIATAIQFIIGLVIFGAFLWFFIDRSRCMFRGSCGGNE